MSRTITDFDWLDELNIRRFIDPLAIIAIDHAAALASSADPADRARIRDLITALQVGEIDAPGAIRDLAAPDHELVRRLALGCLLPFLTQVEDKGQV